MSLVSSIAAAVTPAPSFSFPAPASATSDAAGPSFGETLQGALQSVNTQQTQAGQMAQDFAAGRTSDIHGVMIASQQATIALQLAVEVRNKMVDAYQEVMRISM